MIVGANSYRWAQHYEHQSPPSSVEQNIDEALGNAVAVGIESWEPSWDSEDKFDIYAKALPKHGLKMASVCGRGGNAVHDGPWRGSPEEQDLA